MHVVLAMFTVYWHERNMVVLIFIQNRSAGNQASSDVLAFSYFTLDD